MIIKNSACISVMVHDAGADDREPGHGAGFRLAEDPIPQLRHDLRNHVNQIFGYGELLVEEAAEGGHQTLIDGLQTIRARGKQVLALINGGLPGEGEAEAAIDLAALRLRLLEPLDRIIADCDDLAAEARDAEQGEFRTDVARIRSAASRLVDLADEMIGNP